jgi:hypothetical protein
MNKFRTIAKTLHTNKLECMCGNSSLSACYIRDTEQKPIEVILVCNSCLNCEKLPFSEYEDMVKVEGM